MYVFYTVIFSDIASATTGKGLKDNYLCVEHQQQGRDAVIAVTYDMS